MDFETLKDKVEKQKANQKKAYLKYYEKNKDIIQQKAREYKVKHKKVKEEKILTPEQQRKREYNKRYQEKIKNNIN
jgi:hypothetical protein